MDWGVGLLLPESYNSVDADPVTVGSADFDPVGEDVAADTASGR